MASPIADRWPGEVGVPGRRGHLAEAESARRGYRVDTALDAKGALEDLWAVANRAPDPNAGLPPGKADSAGSPTGGRVGEAEVDGPSAMVDGLSAMAQAFADADHLSGSGHVLTDLAMLAVHQNQPFLNTDQE